MERRRSEQVGLRPKQADPLFSFVSQVSFMFTHCSFERENAIFKIYECETGSISKWKRKMEMEKPGSKKKK